MTDEVKTGAENEPIVETTPLEFDTTTCPNCGAELMDTPSFLVEHAKETGHPAY